MGTYVEKQGIYIPSVCHKTVKKKKKGSSMVGFIRIICNFAAISNKPISLGYNIPKVLEQRKLTNN